MEKEEVSKYFGTLTEQQVSDLIEIMIGQIKEEFYARRGNAQGAYNADRTN